MQICNVQYKTSKKIAVKLVVILSITLIMAGQNVSDEIRGESIKLMNLLVLSSSN